MCLFNASLKSFKSNLIVFDVLVIFLIKLIKIQGEEQDRVYLKQFSRQLRYGGPRDHVLFTVGLVQNFKPLYVFIQCS